MVAVRPWHVLVLCFLVVLSVVVAGVVIAVIQSQKRR